MSSNYNNFGGVAGNDLRFQNNFSQRGQNNFSQRGRRATDEGKGLLAPWASSRSVGEEQQLQQQQQEFQSPHNSRQNVRFLFASFVWIFWAFLYWVSSLHWLILVLFYVLFVQWSMFPLSLFWSHASSISKAHTHLREHFQALRFTCWLLHFVP